jgi:hypothetical protein
MHHLYRQQCLAAKRFMKLILSFLLGAALNLNAQTQNSIPCSDPVYRMFDFWVGEWDVFAKKGNKAGDSKISIILDSCIILEEWASIAQPGKFSFKGKSFNTYNSNSKQWQQTWVDNGGSTTHYIFGSYSENKMEFKTAPFNLSRDTVAILRLTFFKLNTDRVRQLGEQSKDNGKTWTTQYDLEYRRKK